MYSDVLKGVKVLELATYAAAPGCARLLADWGADVIKIEPKTGDPFRYYGPAMGTPISEDENPFFLMENANKRGIVINMKSEEGKEMFHRILSKVDVFLTNVRGDSLAKQGIDYESMSAKHPHLVWAHVTGQGEFGPDANIAGYDITSYWARGGALVDFVNPGAYPLNAPSGLADHATNYLTACGICAALVKQKQTGIGSRVVTSLYGLAVWSAALYAISTQYGMEYPNDRYKAFNPLQTAYRCSDGEWIQIVAPVHAKEYPVLCKVLGLDHMADDPRYNTMAELVKEDHRGELIRAFEEAFAKKTSAEYEQMLTEADIAYAHCKHFKDFATDCQALANNYMVPHTFKSGNTILMPANVITFSTQEPAPINDAPAIGEHTIEVMKEYGYSDEEIAKMIESGAVVAKQ